MSEPIRILVPVDLSDASSGALDRGALLAGEEGELHILYVLPALSPMEPGVTWGTVTDRTRIEATTPHIKAMVADKPYDAVVHVVVGGHGNPAATITDFAQDLGADMIAIPSHGRTGLARMAIGSVAERVVRYANCPVLVVRRESPEEAVAPLVPAL